MDQIGEALNELLKVEPIEEFLGVIVHKATGESEKSEVFINNIVNAFSSLNAETKELAIIKILRAATTSNLSHLKVLMEALHKLTTANLISARIMCNKILTCDKLIYENKSFWIECFTLIKKIITNVDYKGVREIMKACRDKALLFPVNIDGSILPQLLVLEETISFIFDRNNCLLPAYFVANEIMKSSQSHWKINKLMIDFVEEFRDIAQMVSIIGHSNMLPITEHFGYADHLMNSWKLDHNTLKFTFKGSLPYDPELLEPQSALLRHVLDQPYSKEMVTTMLNFQNKQKQSCNALQEQLVNLMIKAMERSELDEKLCKEEMIAQNEWIWLHLSSQLIYFVLLQMVSFMQVVISLNDKLSKCELRKGRDQLMWTLLQFISGSIQKNPISTFLPMFKLFDILYPEQEPLKLPDCNKPSSIRQMAPICIWIHLMKKARLENINICRSVPIALRNHHEYLQHLVMSNLNHTISLNTDFRIILLANAYSTNQEHFTRPMQILAEMLNGSQKNQSVNPANMQLPTQPFSMVILDSLTVHSKMSLIHNFVTTLIKNAQNKTTTPAPALIETYSRLLVYTEIESLGIKGFLNQLFPAVFKSHAWGILHTLLEMFSYRLHHIPTHCRVQLLSNLHSVTSVPQTNKMQLNLCFESTALRLITGLGSVEVQPQLSRYFNEKTPGSVVSSESEELNRVLILTLARSMHITGSGNELQAWCKDLLTNIMQNTPHSWTSHSLACFPPALQEFFTQNTIPLENKQLLKKSVDEEYRNWISMSNENDIIAHFIRPNTTPLFLCLLFKMIWETENISPVAYKILEGINTRAFSAHLRKLCDYLVYEVANLNSTKDFIHKCVDTINNMIWKYNVVTIDRLVLCLALRTQEGNEAQVCFLIIQLLLLKTSELRNRVQEIVKDNSPDHWKQSNWHEKHLAFHQKFPEKFASDESASHPPLPVYFGNVCLRFLPALDIVIHRFIELPIQHVSQILEGILDHLSCLYKFHDRPITYLYSTLHFYERILRDRPSLKRKLVSSVIGALNDVRPPNWALSEKYQQYLKSQDILWNPELPYYYYLVKRLVDAISGQNYFYMTDWRFNEFLNAPCHALYVTCVELLSLPIAPTIVANNLIDVIVKGSSLLPQNEIYSFINATGIIMSALPETYWSVIYDRIQEILSSHKMLNWRYRYSAFELFNFKTVQESMLENTYASVLAVIHSIFHHMGCFKLATITHYIKDRLRPLIKTEHQYIYLCHIVGPFLQRIDYEKTNSVAEIAIVLYELLEIVDKNHGLKPLEYMDPICDFLYHIKYIYVGDIIKNESEAVIKRLRPALQMRLRFIAHINVEEIGSEKSIEPNHQQLTVPQNQIMNTQHQQSHQQPHPQPHPQQHPQQHPQPQPLQQQQQQQQHQQQQQQQQQQVQQTQQMQHQQHQQQPSPNPAQINQQQMLNVHLQQQQNIRPHQYIPQQQQVHNQPHLQQMLQQQQAYVQQQQQQKHLLMQQQQQHNMGMRHN